MPNQKGAAPILLLVAALGLIIFLFITSTFDFKDKLFSTLFPKPPSFAASSTDTSYNMGVLVLKYFPLTTDGQNINITVTGDLGDLYTTIKQRTVDVTNNLKVSLEKATKYLGYKDSTSQSSLIYQIIDTKEYTQAVPMLTDGTRRPDYHKIMTDHNICDYVENKGVSEVWLWAYQGPAYPGTSVPYLGISESKMASSFGDISNSGRYNDMPICNKTYRIYTFNYSRGTGEAIHSWGHQIEAEMDAIDSNFFRNIFQGPNYPQTSGVNGRCGSVHNPPNARFGYDYGNQIPQKSDCLDWNPDELGPLSDISCNNWNPGCQDINDSTNNQLNWIVWMWQNLPGRNNTKTYQGKPLRNFWDIHGDFDRVMGNDKTFILSGGIPSPSPSPSSSPSINPSPAASVNPSPSPSSSPALSPSPTPYQSTPPLPSPTPVASSNPPLAPTAQIPVSNIPKAQLNDYFYHQSLSTSPPPAAPAPVSGNTNIPANQQTQRPAGVSPTPAANITRPAPPPKTTVFTPPSFKIPELKEEPKPEPQENPGVFGGFVKAVNSFNDNLVQTLLKLLQNFGLLKNTET